MDVRCCCNPGKLIGTVPDFPVLTDVGTQIMAHFREVRVELPGASGDLVPVDVACCYLIDPEIGMRKPKVAIKSNDLPVEYYKKIEGFVEA